MTPEKEIEIIRWMKDNYPTFETNLTQIWEMVRMLNDYHESEVKKLNILTVSNAKQKVCPVCKKTFEKGWGKFCSQDCWDIDMQGKLTANGWEYKQ